MKLICVALILAGSIALAASGAVADETLPKKVLPQRSESLELPGLNAGCHICEWRPSPNQMAAPEQCGTNDNGKGNVGLFECGFAEDCQRECHFIRCGKL